jgi:hypothetical protein
MWIESLRQFLNHSFQRFTDWLRGLERLPARWFHREPTLQSLPVLEGFGPGSVEVSLDPHTGRWVADLSYHYRSLTCRLRVTELEPPSGLQRLCAVLRVPDQD